MLRPYPSVTPSLPQRTDPRVDQPSSSDIQVEKVQSVELTPKRPVDQDAPTAQHHYSSKIAPTAISLRIVPTLRRKRSPLKFTLSFWGGHPSSGRRRRGRRRRACLYITVMLSETDDAAEASVHPASLSSGTSDHFPSHSTCNGNALSLLGARTRYQSQRCQMQGYRGLNVRVNRR